MTHPPVPPPKHDSEKACPGLDPGWVPVFGEGSCFTKKLEGDDESKKNHPARAGAAIGQAWLSILVDCGCRRLKMEARKAVAASWTATATPVSETMRVRMTPE
jgi:hypothetical protein